jgi:hypothetical protein
MRDQLGVGHLDGYQTVELIVMGRSTSIGLIRKDIYILVNLPARQWRLSFVHLLCPAVANL